MGRFIQNAQRQPGPSVNHPPSKGPATEDTANTAPIRPMYLPRSRAGTTSAMDACDRIINPPPPSPWIARPAISQFMSPAKAPTMEPTESPVTNIQSPTTAMTTSETYGVQS